MKLGETQTLTVVKITDFGVYLANPGDEDGSSVLLPKAQVPEGTQMGDAITVFLYRDSSDRLIATVKEPLIHLGETAKLKVKDATKVGAFLDMGLEKDLLLPFREQSRKVEKGDECLVALYIDKSDRLAATMRVYPYLSGDSPYERDDTVSGTVYEISEDMGVFVAVDDRYYGLIPKQEVYGEYRVGDVTEARVSKVREDGKLNLSPRQKAYRQMEDDACLVMKKIWEMGGVLPFTDKADPEVIKREFSMSKNAFKRAVGRLLKEKKIKITKTSIIACDSEKDDKG